VTDYWLLIIFIITNYKAGITKTCYSVVNKIRSTAHNIQTLKEMEIKGDSPQNYKETFLTNNNTQ